MGATAAITQIPIPRGWTDCVCVCLLSAFIQVTTFTKVKSEQLLSWSVAGCQACLEPRLMTEHNAADTPSFMEDKEQGVCLLGRGAHMLHRVTTIYFATLTVTKRPSSLLNKVGKVKKGCIYTV